MQLLLPQTSPFPTSLDLAPVARLPIELPPATVDAVLASPGPTTLGRYDVVYFSGAEAYGERDSASPALPPIVEPFVQRGHRVFVVRSSVDLAPRSAGPPRYRELATNVIDVQLNARPEASDWLDAPDNPVLDALAALRYNFGIETSISIAASAQWQPIAHRARAR